LPYDTLVWHYTATFVDQDVGVREVRAMHLARGFADIGYHGLVRLGGTFEPGRPETQTGAHVLGQNRSKLGYVTVGGLTRALGEGVGVDTRNEAQKRTQERVTQEALARYPTIKRVIGHRDLAATQCPAYDVAAWWAGVQGEPKRPMPNTRPVVPSQTHRYLRRGARGAEVRHLQEHLARLGHYGGRIDGIFGRVTEAAVIALQRDAGLTGPNMGQVGNTTWAEILLRDPHR